MDLDWLTHQDLIEDLLQCAILHFVAYKSTSRLLRWEVIVFVSLSPPKNSCRARSGVAEQSLLSLPCFNDLCHLPFCLSHSLDGVRCSGDAMCQV